MSTNASMTVERPGHPTDGHHAPQGLLPLMVGALGVVYGDIGTSPLYTVKEIFDPASGLTLEPGHVIGAVSTIIWALMFVVTLKYVTLILRADNAGEGGILALTALAGKAVGHGSARLKHGLLILGVFGAALFYGDSVITPAISVLSAIEGLETLTPRLAPFVMPIAVTVILGLFLGQRFGTAVVGRLFGPIIVLWFGVLAVSGAVQIFQHPGILTALNPLHALAFIHDRGPALFVAMGSIVLALTGAEALYADMGHFGKRPIRVAWSSYVLPALVLNYMGQGALLIANPAALSNPFFQLFHSSLLLPMVILATLASVIASQAVISGAFSMTRQAIQLGLLPRLMVLQTSAAEAGQIYVPFVNWTVMAAVLMATLGFGSSSALASAYGIAVTVTMLITTALTFVVVRYCWHMPMWLAVGATSVFLVVDTVFVLSCMLKFVEGGWFPLLLGGLLFTVMATWKRGRELVVSHIRKDDPELEPFIDVLVGDENLRRVPRTAVFAVSNPVTVPQALLHNLKHNQVLHETNVLLHVRFSPVPYVRQAQRLEVQSLGHGFWRVYMTYGFKDEPDVPRDLHHCGEDGLTVDPSSASYFLSREIVIPTPGDGMAQWREALFATMARNASSIADYFHLPHNQVVELGTRVQI